MSKVKEFSTVIIDEASQAIDLSTLIPLKYGCRSCILVGDPQQLPATIISKKALEFRYETSMMSRFIKDKYPCTLLDIQYRMHPMIREFPSKHFYDDKLKDGENTLSSSYTKVFHSDPKFAPFVFFDVDSKNENKGHSLTNKIEADFILNLITRFQNQYGSKELFEKLGIITPYKAQLDYLRYIFKNQLSIISDSIEFNTIDGFQGKEKDIIILSCVRSYKKNSVGFLSDIRRMNVALTRAKYSLWIVGNAKSLIINSHWNDLITFSRESNNYIEVKNPNNFWNVQNSSKKKEKEKMILIKKT